MVSSKRNGGKKADCANKSDQNNNSNNSNNSNTSNNRDSDSKTPAATASESSASQAWSPLSPATTLAQTVELFSSIPQSSQVGQDHVFEDWDSFSQTVALAVDELTCGGVDEMSAPLFSATPASCTTNHPAVVTDDDSAKAVATPTTTSLPTSSSSFTHNSANEANEEAAPAAFDELQPLSSYLRPTAFPKQSRYSSAVQNAMRRMSNILEHLSPTAPPPQLQVEATEEDEE